MTKMTIKDIDVTGKKALVRVDFNVPLDPATGEITDDTRIQAALPTIDYLIQHNARVILMSHLGRPDGQVVAKLSLSGVAVRLSQILGKKVGFVNDCIGPEVEKAAAELKDGGVLLLENLRFHKEEEEGNVEFARSLARPSDIYVNDAFGTAHRAHASISGITKFLPAVAGFLLEKEITFLGNALDNPVHPFAALIGGAKISDKVKMLERITQKVNYLLIGGGMAGTFLKAQDYEIGKSLFEPDRIGVALDLLKKASHDGFELFLPVDVVVTDTITTDAAKATVAVDKIPADKKIVDIGPETIAKFSGILRSCKTVFWNGPMGIYEIAPFANGTQEMAHAVAGLNATTVIGGGSTAEAIEEMGLADKMTFVSTGGGASLSFLSGEKLPGVEALKEK